MKILKKVLAVVLILILLPFLIALFTAKEYSVKKEITIDAPKNEVFDFISHMKNMDKFSSWAEMDPNMEQTYSGTDGQVGFISAWKSDNKDVGTGEQEITKIIPGERLDFDLRFSEPFQSSDTGYFTTERVANNQTKVTWGFDAHMDYPMNIMMLFMDFEEMIGNDFDKSLAKLKILMEK